MENRPCSRGFYRNSGGIAFCLKGVMEISFQKQTDVKKSDLMLTTSDKKI